MRDGFQAADEPGAQAATDLAHASHVPGGPDAARRFVAGTLLARPWFDRATLFALKNMLFPASRLFAATQGAAGDMDRFLAAVPLHLNTRQRQRLAPVLAHVDEARAAANAIDSEWQRVFFDISTAPADTSAAHCRAVEGARLSLRHAYNSCRWSLRTRAPWTIPRAKLAIEPPAAVEAIYGGGRAAFNRLSAPPPDMPPVTVSRTLATSQGNDYWLRFPSPSARLGDMVYARVHEPAGASNPPTIIFGHGVCVDFDHWKGLLDESQALVQRGFRVIRPEAPWHGRRTPTGYFAGERTISAFPMGMLDSMAGALQEWAVLADWARRQSSGALVFGGSSLGAMTAQLAAGRSVDWPAAIRPDALFLVTHTGDMAAAALDGALANLWANPEDMVQSGWTPATARPYLSLLNPVDPMPIPAHRIVSILGRRDVVLPFESGRQLVARWGLPASNSFIWDRGHFSVPTTLIRTTTPLDRLTEVVHRM